MKNKNLYYVIIFVIVIAGMAVANKLSQKDAGGGEVTATAEEPVTDQHMIYLAGTYNVTVSGYYGGSRETYYLGKRGYAEWESGGVKKSGVWRYDSDGIVISINGNTGRIVEEYKEVNGILTNTDNPNRTMSK